jgi:aryl sulfotransferase
VDDLPAQIVRIARFIGVAPAALNMDAIEEHCSFAYMRTRAERLAPFGGAHMGDPKAFFHKGPERDFRAVLTPEQIDRFDRAVLDALGLACARWLETGEEPPAALLGAA